MQIETHLFGRWTIFIPLFLPTAYANISPTVTATILLETLFVEHGPILPVKYLFVKMVDERVEALHNVA